MATTPSLNALAYHEPDIVTLLILSTFLLSLNIVNAALDKLIYCGLLGQVFLGIAWGTPGFKWLGTEEEIVIVNLGYLGLILIVYEGGLSTDFKALKANLGLSAGVALTGISVPIGLSYVLSTLAGATSLQAFAAGAALCSTSLGTTFTVLGTSGLTNTRMGVVLTSAAMMDDVVGLVMVQVISNLGQSSTSFSAVTVIRPVFVSLAFAALAPLAAFVIAKPVTRLINERRQSWRNERVESIITSSRFVFLCHTIILLGMVTGSSYAGTSNLFAAYLAGALVSWWDSEVPHTSMKCMPEGKCSSNINTTVAAPIESPSSKIESSEAALSPDTESVLHIGGSKIFARYYHEPLERILKPFFFASIGFSIPITSLFSGAIVWRGIIYTMLMFIGKMFCGLWLVRVSLKSTLDPLSWVQRKGKKNQEAVELQSLNGNSSNPNSTKQLSTTDNISTDDWHVVRRPQAASKNDITKDIPDILDTGNTTTARVETCAIGQSQAGSAGTTTSPELTAGSSSGTKHDNAAQKPISVYPSLIVGTAMTARGEIGFLISSLAQSNGIFAASSTTASTESNSGQDSPIFLIVTWAILLCTIFGPICVGLLVRRVKRLEREAKEGGLGREKDVLGVWGVG